MRTNETNEENVEQELQRLYSKGSGSFSTAYRLFKAAKAKSLPVSLQQVTELFSKWETSSRFRQKYKKKSRNTKLIVSGLFQTFQADLLFFTPFNKFIGCLLVVDCFSRKIWAKPFRTKTADEIAKHFDCLINDIKNPPRVLNTDLGNVQ